MGADPERVKGLAPKSEMLTVDDDEMDNVDIYDENDVDKNCCEVDSPKEVGCWYLKCNVGQSPLRCLIDSGASLSLIDPVVFDALDSQAKTPLVDTKTTLHGANGQDLKVHGETYVDLNMGVDTYSVRMIVAQLGGGLQALLGMDFLAAQQSLLNLDEGVLVYDGVEYELVHKLDSSCCLVQLNEVIIVPGRSLVKVTGSVQGELTEPCGDAILETYELGLAPDGVLPPRSLVKIGENGKCSFTLINFENEALKLLPKTPVAQLTMLDDTPDICSLSHDTALTHQEPVASCTESEMCNVIDDSQKHCVDPQNICSSDLEGDNVELHEARCKPPTKSDGQELPDYMEDLYQEAVKNVSASQKQQVKDVLLEYIDLFAAKGMPLGRTSLIEHHIETGDAKPIKTPTRRFGPFYRKIVTEQVQSMLQQGVIQPSQSAWNLPLVLVKKPDGSYRCCEDARLLNEVTQKDAYPLPHISDCLDALVGASLFCSMDLNSGFWQIALESSSRAKTAFSTPDGGHYEFTVLPFGLCNAPATFERLIELVLRGLTWNQCLAFLDDIIVFGKDFDETLVRLKAVFGRLKRANLRLKPSKCHFFQKEVRFLGHCVSQSGVRPDERKIQAVKDWPTPRRLKDVRSFLGLASYYRRFIRSFSTVAAPMTALTEKNKPFVWDEACEQSFNQLKQALIQSPILDYPSPDLSCQFILDCDASEVGIGACLSQVIEGEEKVVAYASKTLSGPQRRYCVTFRELLSVITFTRHFRHYLLGRKFVIRTDHSSLRWLSNFRDLDENMLSRWITRLSEYDYTIVHRRGKSHGNADALSRRPREKCRRKCKRSDCSECTQMIGSVLPTIDEESEEICESEVTPSEPTVLPVSQCHSPSVQLPRSETESESSGQSETSMPCEPVQNVSVQSPSQLVTAPTDQMVISAVANDVASSDEEDAYPPLVNWMDSLPLEELALMQQSDPHISVVMAWKQENKPKPSTDELNGYSETVKALCARWNNLELLAGVLYRRWPLKHDVKQSCLQLVAPPGIQNDIFEQLHGSPLGGHLGITKTIAKVRDRFYWPGSKTDLTLWCKSCERCALAKGSPGHRAKLKPMPVYSFNQRVALDICGPMPESNGYVYVLVLCDYFTKYIQLIPTRSHTALECADAIVNNWITLFGAPRSLHSDQAAEFEGQLFKEMCKLLGMKKSRTSPHHPAGDGLCERANRSMLQMLRTLVNENRDDWYDMLPFIGMAYRSSVQESTGCTPNMMVFGREVDLPVDLQYGAPPRQEVRYRCVSEYVRWLRHSIQKAHELARKNLKKAIKRQKRNYDSKCRPYVCDLKGYCYRFIPPGGSTKMVRVWHGPYRVLEHISEENYIIQLTPTSKPVRCHINNLKPHVGRTPAAWVGYDEDHITQASAATKSSTPVIPEVDSNHSSLSDSSDQGDDQADLPPAVDSTSDDDQSTDAVSDPEVTPEPELRRGTRVRKLPKKYQDYI